MLEQPAAQPQGNGMAVSSLVLGVVGLALGIIPFFGWFLLPAWILAIVFGAVGLKRKQSKGMSYTGLILGIGTLVYKVAFWILFLVGLSQTSV
ncbi:hypothetical protein [Fictibacillus sp. S7]|uniref:hypothetical protein n=1 Tax=Fictibacillus sp. S7 TaxID=2212476 RepID=UPI001F515FD4|nr:hypothetical protein [Fictibacillus sp. S7]